MIFTLHSPIMFKVVNRDIQPREEHGVASGGVKTIIRDISGTTVPEARKLDIVLR
jgi:hypothetical protein